jgi:hypothetical protein
MDSSQKMFRQIINGQSAMKSELLGELGKLRKEMNKGFEESNTKTDKGFKDINDPSGELLFLH